jgi:hypothetical protein
LKSVSLMATVEPPPAAALVVVELVDDAVVLELLLELPHPAIARPPRTANTAIASVDRRVMASLLIPRYRRPGEARDPVLRPR